MIDLRNGDCIEVMKKMIEEGIKVHSIVTDPPYHLTANKKGGNVGFMGKSWDGGDISFRPDTWRLAYNLLLPGGYLLSFGGTRAYHRMACAIEDAGFEIRDTIMWLYGSGFPKSHNVAKAIDKAAGAEREIVGPDPQSARRNKTTSKFSSIYGHIDDAATVPLTAPATAAARQWEGWGTALKPAYEPIIMARKPLIGTVVENVLAHGTGAINIDGCRVEGELGGCPNRFANTDGGWGVKQFHKAPVVRAAGRWPANVIHDGSAEVVERFPITASGAMRREVPAYDGESHTGLLRGRSGPQNQHGDSGSAARFFYCAKTSKSDREEGNNHPTIKPTLLMRYLIKLVTPLNGIVLDPFMGSGSTGKAAVQEGVNFIGIEKEKEYFNIAAKRIKAKKTIFEMEDA